MGKDELLKGVTELYPYFKDSWIDKIKAMPMELLKNATEIRFRCGIGSSVSCGENNYQITNLVPSTDELEELWLKICRGAVYQFESQMENGYIPLPGGHRVGICGTFVINGEGKPRIRDISAMNFRICRDIKGIADHLFPKLLCEGRFCSTLIVSEPCGGKTTLLTDLVRVLSDKGIRSAVVDERGEIASVFRRIPQKKLGPLADVLDGYPKPYGMMIALRTLSPQVLVCDEIGSDAETEKMLEAMNAGVPFLATAHARDEEELFSRPQIRRLKEAGALSKIVLLKGARSPGRVKKVITVNQYDDKDYWCSIDC